MKRPSLAILLGLLLLFFSAANSARSQDQAGAKTSKIGAITVSGSKRFPADQIISASGLKSGDTVTAAQIQEAADRLAALGVFSSVNFRYSLMGAVGGAIAVEFQVREGPTVPVSFDNFPWFTDTELSAAVRDDMGLFTGESPEGGAMVDEIAVVLGKLLASKNIKGSVTHQLIPKAFADGMMMQFRIEGANLKVQSVKFGDSLASSSASLNDRVPDIQGQPYSRFAVEIFENEHVRPLYISKGFLRVQIGPAKSTVTVDADNPTASAVDILIPITPGAAYSWKGVSWQGNTAITSTILDGAIALKPGEIADGMKIETVLQKIESEYTRHGYLDAKLVPQSQFDDTSHQVSYHVSIDEGSQYHMGDLVVTGLSVDAEARLRRVWLIAKGQVFDNGYYENLVTDLSKPTPDIFGEMPIHYTKFGHLLRPNTDQHTVDVLMDFK